MRDPDAREEAFTGKTLAGLQRSGGVGCKSLGFPRQGWGKTSRPGEQGPPPHSPRGWAWWSPSYSSGSAGAAACFGKAVGDADIVSTVVAALQGAALLVQGTDGVLRNLLWWPNPRE